MFHISQRNGAGVGGAGVAQPIVLVLQPPCSSEATPKRSKVAPGPAAAARAEQQAVAGPAAQRSRAAA